MHKNRPANLTAARAVRLVSAVSQQETLLEAKQLAAGYHGHPVVRDVDLQVESGEVVALIGPNGAGKTTTLMTLAGHLRPIGGEVLFRGAPGRKQPAYRRARRGLSFVTEERSIFASLSASENLRVGGCDVDIALNLFPELKPLMRRRAGLLSGGEQQMLTLARALARKPRLLLADELSLGLAPLIVKRLLLAVREAADTDGIGVLLVEQHVRHALRVADRVYVMRRGQIVLQGAAGDVEDRLSEAYLVGTELDAIQGDPQRSSSRAGDATKLEPK
jgi:branched-chain amino acid transport system ATP-binding protein